MRIKPRYLISTTAIILIAGTCYLFMPLLQKGIKGGSSSTSSASMSVITQVKDYIFPSEPSLSPVQYLNFITTPSNGLQCAKKMGELEFTGQYLPTDYFSARQFANNGKGGVADKHDKVTFFQFRISTISGSTDPLTVGTNQDRGLVQLRTQYLSYQAQNDFFLHYGDQVIKCSNYQFEPSFNVLPYVVFTLEFPVSLAGINSKEVTFEYDDKVFNLGKINLIFDSEKIKNTPNLKL